MNTRFLATFRAVAEAGSLAAAARRLSLANASVSEHVRALERELNATLLIRRGRGLVLTNAGQAVLEAAGEVLARVEDLRHRAQSGQPSGMLRVGSISTALITVMPAALRLMAERHPRIELKVLPGTSTQLYGMLERNDLDCALVAEPFFPLPKSLGWRELRREPLVLVTPPDMPGETVEEVLARAPLIRMDREAWTGRLVNAFLKDHGLQPRELFELDAQEAVVIMVAQGLGVSLLPDWGIAAPAGRALRKMPVGDGRYDRVLGLLSHRGPREALADAFSSALTQSLHE